MRTEPLELTGFTIFDAPRLDPVLVIMQDFGGGQGRLILECYGEAWSAYWGAMGNQTLRQFVATCSADYIANRLWPSNTPRAKYRQDYLLRIVQAVQETLRAANSATACGVCKGTGFHPGPYMCVICGGTGSTASAEHRHIYKHNADDTYGICECGKAFKVCPSCGMEIDATGETVDAVREGTK